MPQNKSPVLQQHRKLGRPKEVPLEPPKSQARIEAANRNRLIVVTLRMRHTRSGTAYGPGITKLPRSLALDLQHEEEQSDYVEERFHSTKALIILNERGKIREVPPETFEDDLNNAEPAIVQRGIL